MRIPLKDFQEDAARRVLAFLRRARRDIAEEGDLVAFALSATTGAGKTVIASAVIEALFRGSDAFDFEPDPTAVVLWVTDDPALNEQTRARIQSSADQIPTTHLPTIDENFDAEVFEQGRIYFLNIQKLSKTASWSKSKEGARTYSVWTTIKNTIESNQHTLYLVLDEAHRGMRRNGDKSTETRSTIVQRIINGHDEVPPVPVVWGISATIERFNGAMQSAKNRITYPPVSIDPRVVQASGLLKDVILLDAPNEPGDFTTSLLRAATKAFVDASDLWASYGETQHLAESVVPLMVVQVPNQVQDSQLAGYVDVIRETWSEISDDAMAHVFGEHEPRRAGKYTIAYIKPQDVQEAQDVRVLFAKDAVTTGWDCPRAEVLFSLRKASDRVHITQLLGRMVRTPLGERVPGDERLNAVSCFLPEFAKRTLYDVAARLTGKSDDSDEVDRELANSSRRVIVTPVELERNTLVPEGTIGLLQSLPSMPRPRSEARPVRRLIALTAELAIDGLEHHPKEMALSRIYGVLDGKLAQHAKEVQRVVDEIKEASIVRIRSAAGESGYTETVHILRADARAIDDRYRAASRALGAAVANGFAKRLAVIAGGDDPDFLEIKARIAALVSIEDVGRDVDDEAERTTKEWLVAHKVDIAHLDDARRAAYGEIYAQARQPEQRDVEIPTHMTVEGSDRDAHVLSTATLHVLADGIGDFPIGDLKSWEQSVVKAEVKRSQTVAWYRNPSSASVHALQVPYKKDGKWAVMLPDFVFVSQKRSGELAASIVDPHGDHLSDALPKLIGLADYAEGYGDAYLRIHSVAENSKGDLVMLDMKRKEVRQAVRAAKSASSLYNGAVAEAYL